MRRFFFFLFVCWQSTRCPAQIFGGSPPSVHWKYIHVNPANIIYPPGMEAEAAQVAYLVSKLSETTLSTIGPQQRPVDIIFRNLTTISNGYVQLAPFRSEFQLTPLQNSFQLGSLPWNQTLAIHEYRHVQQYNNFRVGLSKAMYYVFGQDGLALANNVAVPDWFFEGDAVYQETLVSQQGRGRLPLFLTGFNALWIADKNYSWMKIRNGSYRDFTPDHYPLGYMLVSYGRERWGADFWAKTAGQAAAFRGLFYPLQHALKRNSGIPFDRFRDSALNYFRLQLPKDAAAGPLAVYGLQHRHFVSDQLFPQFTDSSKIVFLNSGYRLPPAFFTKETGSGAERLLQYRAVAIDDAFSYGSGLIVYAAYEPDLRWGWRDYSVLRVFDPVTKKDRRITNKTKYFAPAIAPDARSVAAVDMTETGKSFLDILDIHSGSRLLRLPNPDHLVYTYPKFVDSAHLITAVRNTAGAMALMEITIPSGNQELITNWSMDVLGFVSVEENKIYFTKTFNGADQGFYWDGGKIYSLRAPATTGNYQLSAGYGQIAYNSFSSAGFRISANNLANAFLLQPQGFPAADTSEKHKLFALDQTPFQIPQRVPDSGFQEKKYPAGTRLFNFYSWRPYINDPDFTLALLGENVLNNFQSEIYVGYNRNEEYKKAGADFIYGGLFPFLQAGAEYMFQRNGYFGEQKIYWNELLTYAGASVPLNFSRGRWITNISGGTNISLHQRYFQEPYKDSITTGYISLDPQLLFTHQLQAGRMQIYPSYAQTLTIVYNKAISKISGNQFLATGNFYFPGLTATHSLMIRGSVQQRDSSNQIRFSSSFPFSRGYSGENFYRMYGFGINYNLPLVYPDWGFANLVYFLRVRANGFFDYTGIPAYTTNQGYVPLQYRSVGLEVFLDTRWWNELPISLGIRYSRLLDADYEGRGRNQWELILPLNILDKGYSNHLTNL